MFFECLKIWQWFVTGLSSYLKQKYMDQMIETIPEFPLKEDEDSVDFIRWLVEDYGEFSNSLHCTILSCRLWRSLALEGFDTEIN